MKKIILLLMLSSIDCEAQFVLENERPIHLEGLICTERIFVITDSIGGCCLTMKDDEVLVVEDSLCAITILLKNYRDLLQTTRKDYELLLAASLILSYTKIDGTITNWKKWTLAVEEYKKLLNH